ncbi:MAG: (d)CMP kinase [Dysgonamonadaceae bacterium]|jgi:cytidylate kinase|nr:(d)CMP kinase [Dysgonamonadaceae bacterium]
MDKKKIIIAIDGHSSCGKSTMAKDLAKTIGYAYIDSGAMYRAITLYSLENKLFHGNELDSDGLKKELKNIHVSFRFNPEAGRSETYLNGRNVEKEIRSMEVADKVSIIAAIGFIREEMVCQQQAMGKEKGIVMDGRDVGTVVFPDSELKIFVTASPEIRAQRRLDELKVKGEEASFEEVLNNLKTRDYIDSTRKDGPLKQADDALVLDNSHLTIEEQNKKLLDWYRARV